MIGGRWLALSLRGGQSGRGGGGATGVFQSVAPHLNQVTHHTDKSAAIVSPSIQVSIPVSIQVSIIEIGAKSIRFSAESWKLKVESWRKRKRREKKTKMKMLKQRFRERDLSWISGSHTGSSASAPATTPTTPSVMAVAIPPVSILTNAHLPTPSAMMAASPEVCDSPLLPVSPVFPVTPGSPSSLAMERPRKKLSFRDPEVTTSGKTGSGEQVVHLVALKDQPFSDSMENVDLEVNCHPFYPPPSHPPTHPPTHPPFNFNWYHDIKQLIDWWWHWIPDSMVVIHGPIECRRLEWQLTTAGGVSGV